MPDEITKNNLREKKITKKSYLRGHFIEIQ